MKVFSYHQQIAPDNKQGGQQPSSVQHKIPGGNLVEWKLNEVYDDKAVGLNKVPVQSQVTDFSGKQSREFRLLQIDTDVDQETPAGMSRSPETGLKISKKLSQFNNKFINNFTATAKRSQKERSINSGGQGDTFRVNDEDEELDNIFRDEDALDIDMNINIEKQGRDVQRMANFDQIYSTQDPNAQCQIITGRRQTEPSNKMSYKACRLMQVDIHGHKTSTSKFAQFQVSKPQYTKSKHDDLRLVGKYRSSTIVNNDKSSMRRRKQINTISRLPRAGYNKSHSNNSQSDIEGTSKVESRWQAQARFHNDPDQFKSIQIKGEHMVTHALTPHDLRLDEPFMLQKGKKPIKVPQERRSVIKKSKNKQQQPLNTSLYIFEPGETQQTKQDDNQLEMVGHQYKNTAPAPQPTKTTSQNDHTFNDTVSAEMTQLNGTNGINQTLLYVGPIDKNQTLKQNKPKNKNNQSKQIEKDLNYQIALTNIQLRKQIQDKQRTSSPNNTASGNGNNTNQNLDTFLKGLMSAKTATAKSKSTKLNINFNNLNKKMTEARSLANTSLDYESPAIFDMNFDALKIQKATLNASPSSSKVKLSSNRQTQANDVMSNMQPDPPQNHRSGCRCHNPSPKKENLDHRYHIDRRNYEAQKYPFEEIFKDDKSTGRKKKIMNDQTGRNFNQDLLVVKSFTKSDLTKSIRKSSAKKYIKYERHQINSDFIDDSPKMHSNQQIMKNSSGLTFQDALMIQKSSETHIKKVQQNQSNEFESPIVLFDQKIQNIPETFDKEILSEQNAINIPNIIQQAESSAQRSCVESVHRMINSEPSHVQSHQVASSQFQNLISEKSPYDTQNKNDGTERWQAQFQINIKNTRQAENGEQISESNKENVFSKYSQNQAQLDPRSSNSSSMMVMQENYCNQSKDDSLDQPQLNDDTNQLVLNQTKMNSQSFEMGNIVDLNQFPRAQDQFNDYNNVFENNDETVETIRDNASKDKQKEVDHIDLVQNEALKSSLLAHQLIVNKVNNYDRSLRDIQSHLFKKKIIRVQSNDVTAGSKRSEQMNLKEQPSQILSDKTRPQTLKRQSRSAIDKQTKGPRSLTKAALLASRQYQMNMQYTQIILINQQRQAMRGMISALNRTLPPDNKCSRKENAQTQLKDTSNSSWRHLDAQVIDFPEVGYQQNLLVHDPKCNFILHEQSGKKKKCSCFVNSTQKITSKQSSQFGDQVGQDYYHTSNNVVQAIVQSKKKQKSRSRQSSQPPQNEGQSDYEFNNDANQPSQQMVFSPNKEGNLQGASQSKIDREHQSSADASVASPLQMTYDAKLDSKMQVRIQNKGSSEGLYEQSIKQNLQQNEQIIENFQQLSNKMQPNKHTNSFEQPSMNRLIKNQLNEINLFSIQQLQTPPLAQEGNQDLTKNKEPKIIKHDQAEFRSLDQLLNLDIGNQQQNETLDEEACNDGDGNGDKRDPNDQFEIKNGDLNQIQQENEPKIEEDHIEMIQVVENLENEEMSSYEITKQNSKENFNRKKQKDVGQFQQIYHLEKNKRKTPKRLERSESDGSQGKFVPEFLVVGKQATFGVQKKKEQTDVKSQDKKKRSIKFKRLKMPQVKKEGFSVTGTEDMLAARSSRSPLMKKNDVLNNEFSAVGQQNGQRESDMKKSPSNRSVIVTQSNMECKFLDPQTQNNQVRSPLDRSKSQISFMKDMSNQLHSQKKETEYDQFKEQQYQSTQQKAYSSNFSVKKNADLHVINDLEQNDQDFQFIEGVQTKMNPDLQINAKNQWGAQQSTSTFSPYYIEGRNRFQNATSSFHKFEIQKTDDKDLHKKTIDDLINYDQLSNGSIQSKEKDKELKESSRLSRVDFKSPLDQQQIKQNQSRIQQLNIGNQKYITGQFDSIQTDSKNNLNKKQSSKGLMRASQQKVRARRFMSKSTVQCGQLEIVNDKNFKIQEQDKQLQKNPRTSLSNQNLIEIPKESHKKLMPNKSSGQNNDIKYNSFDNKSKNLKNDLSIYSKQQLQNELTELKNNINTSITKSCKNQVSLQNIEIKRDIIDLNFNDGNEQSHNTISSIKNNHIKSRSLNFKLRHQKNIQNLKNLDIRRKEAKLIRDQLRNYQDYGMSYRLTDKQINDIAESSAATDDMVLRATMQKSNSDHDKGIQADSFQSKNEDSNLQLKFQFSSNIAPNDQDKKDKIEQIQKGKQQIAQTKPRPKTQNKKRNDVQNQYRMSMRLSGNNAKLFSKYDIDVERIIQQRKQLNQTITAGEYPIFKNQQNHKSSIGLSQNIQTCDYQEADLDNADIVFDNGTIQNELYESSSKQNQQGVFITASIVQEQGVWDAMNYQKKVDRQENQNKKNRNQDNSTNNFATNFKKMIKHNRPKTSVGNPKIKDYQIHDLIEQKDSCSDVNPLDQLINHNLEQESWQIAMTSDSNGRGQRQEGNEQKGRVFNVSTLPKNLNQVKMRANYRRNLTIDANRRPSQKEKAYASIRARANVNYSREANALMRRTSPDLDISKLKFQKKKLVKEMQKFNLVIENFEKQDETAQIQQKTEKDPITNCNRLLLVQNKQNRMQNQFSKERQQSHYKFFDHRRQYFDQTLIRNGSEHGISKLFPQEAQLKSRVWKRKVADSINIRPIYETKQTKIQYEKLSQLGKQLFPDAI